MIINYEVLDVGSILHCRKGSFLMEDTPLNKALHLEVFLTAFLTAFLAVFLATFLTTFLVAALATTFLATVLATLATTFLVWAGLGVTDLALGVTALGVEALVEDLATDPLVICKILCVFFLGGEKIYSFCFFF